MDEVIAGYAAAATPAMIAGYDSLDPMRVHAAMLDLFPAPPARIVDIGAGTGRDAAWLAQKGHDVVAIEPVRAFREAGVAIHGDAIRWMDDRLPDLANVRGGYDLVLLCAVWHHLDLVARAQAMPNLARLTAVGGRLLLSLRHGPGHEDRRAHAAPPVEAIALAKASKLSLLRRAEAEAVHAESRAAGVHWTWLAFERRA